MFTNNQSFTNQTLTFMSSRFRDNFFLFVRLSILDLGVLKKMEISRCNVNAETREDKILEIFSPLSLL